MKKEREGRGTMRSKKHLGTLFILMLLASMATISLPSTSSQSTVTFRVEPNVTSGVAPGELVMVDVYIDSPVGSAIVGWAISIRVNPDVLKPGYDFGPPYGVYWAVSGMDGYFLYDWCMVTVGGKPRWPQGTKFEPGAIDVTAGKITGSIEGIVSWSDLERGVGASGTGKLVTLFFTSKSATGYSPIVIAEAYYYTSWNRPDLDKRVPDVIIHGHYNTQPAHDVAVTYISAPASAVVEDIVPIEVEVFNIGANSETFTLEVSYNTTVIEARPVSLASLAFKTELYSWNTTGVALGSYTLKANATLAGDINLANNVKTTTIEILPAPPDVAVTSVSAPSQATVGDIVGISVTVANLGCPVTLNLKLTYDGTIIGTRLVLLASETSKTELFSWNTTGVALGSYTLKANATLAGDINLANNVKTTTIEILPAPPDVAVTSVSAPSQATVGDIVGISVTVANLGCPVTLNLKLTYDGTIIGTRLVLLASETSKTELFSWNTTGVALGSYTLKANATLAGDINLANNVATTPIEIMPIKIYRVDLMRRSAWPEHHHHVEAKYTMTIKLFAIIENVGTEATYGKVAFTIENPVGVPVGNVETAPQLLAPGEMYGNEKELRYYTSWTVPSYGKYYVTAQVYYDADGDLGTADWTPSPDKPKTFSFSVVP